MKKLAYASLLVGIFLPVVAYGQCRSDEDRSSLGDDYEYSPNVLVSTVEATSTTAGDITLNASSDATTEATSGEGAISNRCSNANAVRFAKTFRKKLAQEIAEGAGEKAEVLAALLGVRSEKIPSFIQISQAHYLEIFPTATVSTEQIVASLASLAEYSQVL